MRLTGGALGACREERLYDAQRHGLTALDLNETELAAMTAALKETLLGAIETTILILAPTRRPSGLSAL
jgi:hypothetical protein